MRAHRRMDLLEALLGGPDAGARCGLGRRVPLHPARRYGRCARRNRRRPLATANMPVLERSFEALSGMIGGPS